MLFLSTGFFVVSWKTMFFFKRIKCRTPDSYFSKWLCCFISIYSLVTAETRADDIRRREAGTKPPASLSCQKTLGLIPSQLKPDVFAV